MPETPEQARERRSKIERGAQARLHGVEMPKRLDFASKKLYHEYVCFKTLTKRILDCYDGIEEKILVGKVLMWMGPEACAKHDHHPWIDDEGSKLGNLWTFFDNICAKRDGTEGSWNAARM
jgi:hypothetical protein